MKMNKKGAEMPIVTILIIIISLVVLVVLIFWFTTGGGNLWAKITGLGGGKSNVATVVQSCQVACSSNNKYDWCRSDRKITGDDGKDFAEKSCDALVIRSNTDAKIGLSACENIPSCA